MRSSRDRSLPAPQTEPLTRPTQSAWPSSDTLETTAGPRLARGSTGPEVSGSPAPRLARYAVTILYREPTYERRLGRKRVVQTVREDVRLALGETLSGLETDTRILAR